MTRQSQDASDGALAVQSGRDTNIQGITTEQMRHIIESLAAQLPAYAALAREIVDARLVDLEDRLMLRMAEKSDERTQSFRDPDFLYLVNRAQSAYARSGDETVRDTLVDLIDNRSKQTERNRLTLSLNEAVETASVLTRNEFAALSLCFLLKNTRNHTVLSIDTFINYYETHIDPLIPDMPEDEASYSYIEAQRCGSISVMTHDLRNILMTSYGGIFNNGFDKWQITDHLPDNYKDAINTLLIRPCINDHSKMQFDAANKEAFDLILHNIGIEPEIMTNAWNMFTGTFWSEDELLERLNGRIATIDKLFRIWATTPLRNLNLTSTGIAIAHANLVRVADWKSDLSIWIK